MREQIIIILGLVSIQVFAQQTIYTIPVVVHVVYNNANENISNARIESQITALNKDFTNSNSDTNLIEEPFKSLVGNSGIRFELANYDPNGQSTNGITRTFTNKVVFGNSDIHRSIDGGKDPWPNDKYLNIWVCNLTPGIQGWSSSPSNINDEDGVVIDYEYFGTSDGVMSPYNLGRTATHEIGHWFGLQHLQGDSGGCSDDDGINDTPLQSASISSCSIPDTSCGTRNMVQNFMQSNEDACLLFFTQNQVSSMRDVLESDRQSILTNSSQVLSNDKSIHHGLTVFPNPTNNGKVNLSILHDDLVSVKVYSLSGVIKFTRPLNSQIGDIDLSYLNSGVYLLQIVGKHEVWFRKIEIIK